jgi:putative FmdB family regulatory protein
MPLYEYVCPVCKEKIEILTTVLQKEKGLKPVCPKCGSKKMIRVFGGFSIGSSRGASGGSFCPPNGRAGCCG